MSWSTIGEKVEMNLDSIARDLCVFADPATPFSVGEIDAGRVLVGMVRDGVPRQYRIDVGSGEVVALDGVGRKYRGIAALLASDDFVDVRQFRATQRRILQQLQDERGGNRPILDPEGKFVSRDGIESPLNRSGLNAVLSQIEPEKLQILLVDGPAGIGKTSLIEMVSFERSAPSSLLPPLLHVTSGGNKLTDLNKALAHSLQIIRAKATFDQMPVLVRHGVVQVAIDGFDELVDPDGYKDAWSALREFLGDVNFGGPIVLSGRDTFFDQQEFERLLADRLPNISIKQARLAPVSPSAAKDYLEESGWAKEELEIAQAAGWFKPGSYYLRPFFLAQIAGEGGWDGLQEAYGSPQSFLVNRMVKREAKLVSQTVDIQIGIAEDALWDFFTSIAEDMTIQQSDQVDEDFIAFACESAFSGRVNSRDVAKLLHRASSFALLESASGRGMRRFPHSELQNQFAARALIVVAQKTSLTNPFIRLSSIDAGLAEAFSDQFSSLGLDNARTVYENLRSMLAHEGFSDRTSSNLGALLLATVGRGDLDPLELKGIAISEVKLVGVARRTLLVDVAVGHLYATDADARAIIFVGGASVAILTIDNSSVLPESMPLSRQLQFVDRGFTRIVRSQDEISALIAPLRMAVDENVRENLPFVKYMDRLCRTFVRQKQIRDHEADASYRLLQEPYWHMARELLGARIVEYSKDAGGPRSVFYRMEDPEGLLVPQSPGDKAVRQKVYDKAKALASS